MIALTEKIVTESNLDSQAAYDCVRAWAVAGLQLGILWRRDPIAGLNNRTDGELDISAFHWNLVDVLYRYENRCERIPHRAEMRLEQLCDCRDPEKQKWGNEPTKALSQRFLRFRRLPPARPPVAGASVRHLILPFRAVTAALSQ